MIARLKHLETIARRLEPDEAQRALWTRRVVDYAETFIQETAGGPAYTATEDMGRALYDSPISEEGLDIETTLQLLRFNVDRPGLNPTSGRFLGYIPGGGLYPAALGDYLAAIANRYAGLFFASPGAVRLENMLLRWMAGVVGYPERSAGNLTSGGSIASLVGLVTARDAHGLEGEAVKRAVVYFTGQTHHAIHKALRIAGLKSCVQRLIPVDHRYRMDADALDKAIATDRAAGLYPWLIIASAGTTNTGSVDPLPAIGDIASGRRLWLHIDGAYGAFFTLCDEGRKILAGMDKSDSIVMDPHKTLFLPYGTGAILVKDRQTVYASHHHAADYMQDTLAALEEPSPADLSPELTKHFRGLRLWLPLKLMGVAPFRAALEEKMLLARYFHQKIQEVAGFEVGPAPDLAVAIYRYKPKRGDANEFNQRLVQEIHRDGRIFVSSTVVDGNFVLRLAVGAYRTHLDDIEQTLDVITEKVRYLECH
jgi:glutamate/tyrosine decarboxylase-like PLP-dependent enzyme